MLFDIYFDENLFNSCRNDGEALIGNYIKRTNLGQYKMRTFDTTMGEGFYFTGEKSGVDMQKVEKSKPEEQIDPKLIEKWGGGLQSNLDYNTLEEHYRYLKSANPNSDSNQEIFISDLCYTKMQQMKAVREGRVDDYNKLTESYRKTFLQAGLKTVRDTNINEEFTIGVNAEAIEKYTPSEYYRNKSLYKDYDNIGEYIERFLLRPLRNLMHGTSDRDKDYYVKDDNEVDEYADE